MFLDSIIVRKKGVTVQLNCLGIMFREQDDDKAEFLAHIGAGYLVWFVYPSVLGVIVSFISVLWRFKIILGWCLFVSLLFTFSL